MTKPIEDARAAIVAERQRWVEASKASDVASINSLLCEDVILMAPNENSLYGRAEACEWFADYFKRFKVVRLDGTDQEIEVSGDTAIELWCYGVSIESLRGGKRIPDEGRFLTIWKRGTDKAWRISQTIWNSIRPVGSGTIRYLSRLQE